MTRIIKQRKANKRIEAEITRLSTFLLNSYFYELCWYSSVPVHSETKKVAVWAFTFAEWFLGQSKNVKIIIIAIENP